jgi:hypothetical protein
MLPDFIAAKKYIRIYLAKLLKKEIEGGDALLSMMRRRTQHEGDQYAIRGVDGQTEESGFEEMASEFAITSDELIEKGVLACAEKLQEAAKEIAKSSSIMMFNRIKGATERTGNVIDGGGKPLTPELLLELMQKVEMDFDDEGNPLNMAFVVSPETWETYKDRFREWDQDPEVVRKRDLIMARKRREWLDRESNRKLVD